MTNKTKTENTAAEAAASQNTQNAENGMTITSNETAEVEMLTNPEAVFSALEKNGEPWRDLSSEYQKFAPGQELDIIHTGQSVRDLAGDGSENKVIEAITRDERSIIIGDAVVVSALWDKPTPKPYRLICTGTKKGSRGNYNTFKVLTW